MFDLIGKKTLSLTLATFLSGLILYLYFSVDPPGYCGTLKRFLPDQDFIDIAMREAIGKGYVDIEGSEAAMRTFHADHPDCCHVDRTPSSFLDRIFGINTVGVYISYAAIAKPLDGRPSSEGFYVVHAKIHACGQVKDMSGGRVEKQTIPIIKQNG